MGIAGDSSRLSLPQGALGDGCFCFCRHVYKSRCSQSIQMIGTFEETDGSGDGED